AGCHASYPSKPSSPSVAGFQLFYRTALGPAFVGQPFVFDAYALNSDGVYELVTPDATWNSSNSAVAAMVSPPSGFTAIGPGLADITATYHGFTSAASIAVYEPDQQPFPFLAINP